MRALALMFLLCACDPAPPPKANEVVFFDGGRNIPWHKIKLSGEQVTCYVFDMQSPPYALVSCLKDAE